MLNVGDIVRGVVGSKYGITNERAEMRVVGAYVDTLHVLVLKIDAGYPQNCVGMTFSGLRADRFELANGCGESYTSTTYMLDDTLSDEDKQIIGEAICSM